MKERLIRQLQQWARTMFTPSLEVVDGKINALSTRQASLINLAEQLDKRLQDLTTALLFDRWESQPFKLNSRNELGYWLNFHALFGEGVEVGVHRGEFSDLLLQTWKGKRLHSVDPWFEFSEDEYKDVCNVAMRDQEENYQCTVERLDHFGARSSILRQTSKDAANSFKTASLDFVYIDAQHHYEAVKEDIELWSDKVRPGGLIGGHDYLDGEIDSGFYGVKRAVDEWVNDNALELHITRESAYPSWFVNKP